MKIYHTSECVAIENWPESEGKSGLFVPGALIRLLPRLNKSDLAVFIVLCGSRDPRSTQVSMSQRLIAQHAGLSDERIVAAAAARLQAFGLLQLIKPATRGRSGRAIWRVCLRSAAADDGPGVLIHHARAVRLRRSSICRNRSKPRQWKHVGPGAAGSIGPPQSRLRKVDGE